MRTAWYLFGLVVGAWVYSVGGWTPVLIVLGLCGTIGAVISAMFWLAERRTAR